MHLFKKLNDSKNGKIGILCPNELLLAFGDELRKEGLNPVVSKVNAPPGFLFLELAVNESNYDDVNKKLQSALNMLEADNKEEQEFIGVLTFYKRVNRLTALLLKNGVTVAAVTPHKGETCFIDIRIKDQKMGVEELISKVDTILAFDNTQTSN